MKPVKKELTPPPSTLVLERIGSARALRDELRQLLRRDAVAEAKHRESLVFVPEALSWDLTVPGVILAVGGGFFWLMDLTLQSRNLGALACVGGVAAIILTVVRRSKLDARESQRSEALWREARHDVDDRKLDAAHRLVDELADEMQGEVALKLDFRRVEQTPPERRKAKGTPQKRTEIAVYAQDWLVVQATLLDGTRLQATAGLQAHRVTRTRETLKTKFKRRGPVTKLKRRAQFQQTVIERLTLEVVPPSARAAQLKEGVGRLRALAGPRAAITPIKRGVRVVIDVASGNVSGPPEREEGAEHFLDGALLMRHVVMTYRALLGAGASTHDGS